MPWLPAPSMRKRSRQLLAVKRRARGDKPLTLAVKSADDALDYLPRMNRLALRLARRCWPGPVTLVCPDNHPESLVKQLPTSVQQAVAPEGLVGLRVPGHDTFLDVLRMLAGPVAMTSANRTGEPEPYNAQQVVSALGDQVDLVLDDGRSRFGQASSVVKVDEQGFEVLRSGVVSEQTLRRLSSLSLLFVCTGNTCRSPMAEAMCRKILAERLGCKPDYHELEEKGRDRDVGGAVGVHGRAAEPRGGGRDALDERRSFPARESAAHGAVDSPCRRDLDDDALAPPGDSDAVARGGQSLRAIVYGHARHSRSDWRSAGAVSALRGTDQGGAGRAIEAD